MLSKYSRYITSPGSLILRYIKVVYYTYFFGGVSHAMEAEYSLQESSNHVGPRVQIQIFGLCLFLLSHLLTRLILS